MEIKDTDYILGFWYAENDNGDTWLLISKRECYSGSVSMAWIGEYRFKYKNGKKNAYTFNTVDKSENSMIDYYDNLLEKMKESYTSTDKLIVQGTLTKFRELAPTKKWIHILRSSR